MITKQQNTTQNDRRIQKTKKLLAEALRQLMMEKDYDAVTIQDITERANVGRSTFYAHYESKEQLVLNNINFHQELVEADINDTAYTMGVNLAYLFNHLRENLSIIKQIGRKKIGQQLADHFTEIIASKIIEYHKRKIFPSKKEQLILEYKAHAIAGGIVRLLF
jgi:Bacterial regulatory proteins, tetR family